jgi:hypothetical protein
VKRKTHKTHSPRGKTKTRTRQRPDTEAAFHPKQGNLNEEETRALLDITQGFRYGELMEPVRTELMSLALQEPALSGWVIRLDLSLAEFELMRGVHLPSIEISFEQHRSGHSALILSTAVDPLHICLAIPLWESGMRRWLEYVAETRQITLLLLSVEDGKYGMTGIQDFNQEDVAEWRKMAKSLQPYRGPLKDHEAMAHLGMEVMTGRAGHLDVQEALQADMRTFVVAQRDNAMKVMNIYSQVAMELEEELAMASQGNPQ